MPAVTRYAPGQFCWYELATTDDRAGRDFYTALFGWTLRGDPTGVAPYTMFRHGGTDVAGAWQLQPDLIAQGVGPHWLHYVSVESAAAAAARAVALGGRVTLGPVDVMDIGRMAMLRDPEGVPFAVWEPLRHVGSGIAGEPGTRCWNELATRDGDAATRFYTGLLPWTAVEQPMGAGRYTRFRTADGDAAGMLGMDARWGDTPAHWMLYLAVDDCDLRAARAASLGATVLVGPFDAGDVGRCAVIRDPQGAVFSIMRLGAGG